MCLDELSFAEKEDLNNIKDYMLMLILDSLDDFNRDDDDFYSPEDFSFVLNLREYNLLSKIKNKQRG